jgi:hypothetical protein
MSDQLLAAALAKRLSVSWPLHHNRVTIVFRNNEDAAAFMRELERGQPTETRPFNSLTDVWQEESDG